MPDKSTYFEDTEKAYLEGYKKGQKTERERCAAIADEVGRENLCYGSGDSDGERIAKNIRSGGIRVCQ